MTDVPFLIDSPLSSDDQAQDWRSHWSLDPRITFLNHGSFGACPTAVLQKQSQLRAQLEQEPLRFFEHELEPLWDAARQTLADFIGADSMTLAFVPNATTGVNTILRSLDFRPGDELLTTNHEYNASRNALEAVAQRTGARVIVAEVAFPIESAAQIEAAVLARVSDRTRLVLLDHITSQTGLIVPIQSIASDLADRGIDLLVDGAHAPGMIPLQLQDLGVAYYTGNCHKWLCAPKGAAFLYVRTDKQAQIRPLTISHGANSPRRDRSRFHLEFDWTGTADPTPYLCVPAAIRYLEALFPGGWAALMRHNRAMAIAARRLLCTALEVTPPCPDEMIGSMAVVPLPSGSAVELKSALFERFSIEVPVTEWQSSTRLIRISAQIYNTQADYDVLTGALLHLLAEECGKF